MLKLIQKTLTKQYTLFYMTFAYVLSIWKTAVTRTIGQINCKWRQKSVVSVFLIWSAASHHIASRATRKIPHKATSVQHMTTQPCHFVLFLCTAARPTLRKQRSTLMKRVRGYESKVTESETEATCAAAKTRLLIADCWCYCLECALLKREYVHC